ncbi:MAG: beta-propeller domain-containing protein, partial [Syntrophomonadaceae bacterium]|nr:beta-propeller domain-containing protein [Syntrophomonadaceae bacterium]
GKEWALVLALVVVTGMLFSMYGLAKPGIAVSPGEEIKSELPVVGSWDNFRQLLEEASKQNESRYFRLKLPLMPGSTAPSQAAFEKSAARNEDTGAGADDFSTTNLQAAGVDEADLVKTDGEYIYQVNRQQLVIIHAVPPENMEVASRIRFEGENFTPQELYLDERCLVVIGSNFQPVEVTESREPGCCLPYCPSQTVKAVVFDHTDKTNLKKLREIELDG